MPDFLPPGPEVNALSSTLERQITGILDKSGFGTSLVNDAEAAGTIGTSALPEELAGVTTTEYLVFGAAAALVADIIVIGLLLGVVIAIRLIRYLEQVLLFIVGKIPFGVGGGLQGDLRTIFSVIDPLELRVAKSCSDRGIALINTSMNLIYWCLHFFGLEPLPSSSSQPGQADQLHTLQAEVNNINAKLKYVIEHQGVVDYITTPSGQAVVAPRNLWDQLHSVENDVKQLQQAVVNIDAKNQSQGAQIHQLSTEMSVLTGSIHDIRAVATGWQDVEQQISTLQRSVVSFTNATQTDIERQRAKLELLMPLLLLTTAGPAGMKILRQLEDTPCMCPKVPNFPSLTPEWLAIYEFISNG